ncbi:MULTISPECIES: biofilm regulation diguanylate cyclase SiaD [Aphanothece]|uniref:biofilm regulation diguanylate cyclase SiaD n=1 Tax=Aphanothece TaxID=1121 RepID=UPI003984E379
MADSVSGLDDELDARVESLLKDPQYIGHPLREALADLTARMAQNLTRLERIIRISDRYQTDFQDHVHDLSKSYDRRIRSLERAIRISDRYQSRLHDINHALQLISTHDQLTGVPNRRLLSDRCRAEDKRAARHGTTYSMALIDVDYFKRVNDTYGHSVGDAVLVELAKVLRSCIRDFDLCARWGGEEFLALFVDADITMAERISQRMIDRVRQLRVSAEGHVVNITVSIGVAQHLREEDYAATFSRADAVLLQAKSAGRDRILLDERRPTPPIEA